jgi:hypothetical protein
MDGNKCDWVKAQQMRKIRPTRQSVSGVHVFRGQTSIPHESTLERDFLIRHEFSLAVHEIVPQPCQIPFTGRNGQTFIYTPDFLVYFHTDNHPTGRSPKPQLIEVKPEAKWRKHWREWLPKWKAAYRYAKDRGWEFHIRDESRIRDQAFRNIRFLERYKRMHFPSDDSQALVQHLRQRGSTPVQSILSQYFKDPQSRGTSHIWHLLAMRELECDISQPLNNLSELWVPSNE